MASNYDDELWALVPDVSHPAPAHLVAFVRSLGHVEHALDLGCGDGRLTVALDATSLSAADVSALALERARRRLPDAELVELEPGGRLPFDDASYDLVLCAETIEHVQDVQRLLSEVRRVLRPGATLALTTPAHGRASALAMLVRGPEALLDPFSPHLRFFTKRSLAGVLDRLGFEPLSLTRGRGTLLATARR